MPGRARGRCVNQLNDLALRDEFRQVCVSVKCVSDRSIGPIESRSQHENQSDKTHAEAGDP